MAIRDAVCGRQYTTPSKIDFYGGLPTIPSMTMSLADDCTPYGTWIERQPNWRYMVDPVPTSGPGSKSVNSCGTRRIVLAYYLLRTETGHPALEVYRHEDCVPKARGSHYAAISGCPLLEKVARQFVGKPYSHRLECKCNVLFHRCLRDHLTHRIGTSEFITSGKVEDGGETSIVSCSETMCCRSHADSERLAERPKALWNRDCRDS